MEEENYEAVAVDASSIGRQLHEASDDLLVPLRFFSTTHFFSSFFSAERERGEKGGNGDGVLGEIESRVSEI